MAIPWACALIATYAVSKAAGRAGRLTLFGCASLAIAAVAMFVTVGASPLVAVIALCVAVVGLWEVQPIFWTMLTDHLGGIAAVFSVAMVNTIGNLGNFVSPNVKVRADTSFGSSVAGLILLRLVRSSWKPTSNLFHVANDSNATRIGRTSAERRASAMADKQSAKARMFRHLQSHPDVTTLQRYYWAPFVSRPIINTSNASRASFNSCIAAANRANPSVVEASGAPSEKCASSAIEAACTSRAAFATRPSALASLDLFSLFVIARPGSTVRSPVR
ncbi:hypothetical protein [Caballeronia sp. LZ032]|uniref:hypothetical protein n=1 Tax=Caballeronia sp. LZ032 TaxID=3038565 RepID=UPI0028592A54|nr:hypothetical protein [Caballeronia sp. LZ032]MDR5883653.1 hypothetical protein [Caballeronia sp. LZ032]